VEYVRIVVGEERGRSSYVICFFNSLFFNLYVKENNKKARITGSGPQSTEISFRQASRNMFRFSVNTRINVSASPPLVFCSRTKSLKQPLNYASFPLDNEVLSPRENAPVAWRWYSPTSSTKIKTAWSIYSKTSLSQRYDKPANSFSFWPSLLFISVQAL
jgi:hypothetical protein